LGLYKFEFEFLVVRRKHLIVVPTPLLAAPLFLRYASQALDCSAQVVARGAARCALQVLDRSAQAEARGAARCALQERDRGAQAVARGTVSLSQQEETNSGDVQRERVNISGFTCTWQGNPCVDALRRVRVTGRSFAAVLTYDFSAVDKSPAPAE
jgi:hypothetical protein